jgi:two-component system CheB/CheR fusion protein
MGASVVSETRLTIVGIGASAGGIEAFRSFFMAMPSESGLAFVVILHLAPDRKSLLPEILARWTKMPVVTVADGMDVAADRVHVVPPGFLATIERNRLHLRPIGPEERHEAASIDFFFNALAIEARDHAVGIVLSGTGHDGALGLKAIREAGGLTIVQGKDGTTPQYTGMPESAIATGAVDIIAAVDSIPGHLVAARRTCSAIMQAETQDLATDEQRRAICQILLAEVGHDFSQYKDKTFLRRVRRRMQVLSLIDLDEYIARLRQDRGETLLLFRDLLIGVTAFFRDADTFAVLQADVMPLLFNGKGPDDVVRTWIPGCATGEEAYSLAILMLEYADTLPAPPRIQLFATDIDEAAIAAARAGRYPTLLLQNLPPARLRRFFKQSETGYIITKEVRDLCTFSAHSLLRDPPFSRVDMVSCRNLLIYLDSEAQSRVIPIFHYALLPNGLLLLGSSETVSRHDDLFLTLNKKHRIFQRRDAPSALPQLTINAAGASGAFKRPGTAISTSPDNWPSAVARAKARVLETYAAAFVVITANGDVIHYSNHTGAYLEPAHGAPSKNLLEMARPGVRLGLRSAFRRATETGLRVEQRIPGFGEAGSGDGLAVVIEPVAGHDANRIFLVVFKDDRLNPPAQGHSLPPDDPGIIGALERENRDLREQLQSISEEHETALEELRSSSEEMHSVNEELQSSNEELETSREEIQSINEEMSTVNAELTHKVDELDRTNNDLRNLFESTQVATIFLDAHMVIRGFTPEVATIYNLIPSDRGRPITDIVSRLDYRTLREDVRQVLETLQPLEQRVSRVDNTAHYLMRILPYRKPDSSVDGLLVTFIDISNIVRHEQHQRLMIDELNHRVKNMLSVVISLASQTLRRATTLEDFAGVFLGRVHALSAVYELLSARNWSAVLLQDLLVEELRPFMAGDRRNIQMSGPEAALDARGALAVGLAIHELSTNAVKHGALSADEGDVTIAWSIETAADTPFFILNWEERNGPPVQPPAHSGAGLLLIERALTHDLAGQADVTFRLEGVRATIRVPLPTQHARAATAET